MPNNYILVTDYLTSEHDLQTLHKFGTVVRWSEIDEIKAERIIAIVPGASNIIDEDLLQMLPNVKVISCYSVGYENIDVQAAQKRGIEVGYCPKANADAVADFGFTLLLAAARQVISGANYCKEKSNIWSHLTSGVCYKTIGIIGMGAIGFRIAKRSLGFDMIVLYHNRHRRDPDTENQVKAKYCDTLDDLLRLSDYVIITAAATSSSIKLIGRRELNLMKKDAVLVSVSRGTIVDHDALTEAIEKGVIRGAALDMTDPQPLPFDHKLLSFDNVIVTPHMAWATYEAQTKLFEATIDNLAAGLKGQELPSKIKSTSYD